MALTRSCKFFNHTNIIFSYQGREILEFFALLLPQKQSSSVPETQTGGPWLFVYSIVYLRPRSVNSRGYSRLNRPLSRSFSFLSNYIIACNLPNGYHFRRVPLANTS